ncbi:CheR family methyltransferase [Pelosinus sp. sgz500959]|uniref:CheR family methyltransferase n=1 Tax=Pelosinus sp. sgz500959 TaxID=3242472 RepID=UPI00366B0DF6
MDKDTNQLITAIKECLDRDISAYDQAFLWKALNSALSRTGFRRVDDYCSYIKKNSYEAEKLYTSLHITFSQFFRDPLTFAILEQSVIPRIISNKTADHKIRIWSAGCSYGQEPYSIAMLLMDFAENSGIEVPFQIFATDISEEALASARAGVYNESTVQEIKLRQLNKYFTRQGKHYIISPQLKQYISFSNYDLLDVSTANPPESIYGDFDIVFCCNLLIYYRFDSQKYIIKKLRQALSDTGYIVTGEAEKSLLVKSGQLQMLETPSTVFKYNKGRW